MRNQCITVVDDSLAKVMRRLRLADRRVLAAVSGGPDSLCLLVGLSRLGMGLEAAHIDHGLREGSSSEGKLVAEHCRRLGVPFHSQRLSIASTTGVEAAARDARYAALEVLRAARGLDVVATGHTASDQAETVLMRLSRGAALSGAGAILERRADRVVRPLLGVTRQETRAYVEALGLAAVHDPMNDDLTFTRVRVRHEVMPRLVAAMGLGAERALARFARLAHEDDSLLADLARTAHERAMLADGSLDRVALLSLQPPIQRRVLAMFLEQASIPLEATLIDDCLGSIEAGGSATLPLDCLLIARGGKVNIEPAPTRRASG